MRILRYTTTNSFNGKSYLCTTGKLRFHRTKVSRFNVKKLYWILRFIAAILSVLMFSYFQSIKQKTAFKMNLRYLQYGKLNISKGVFLKFISSMIIPYFNTDSQKCDSRLITYASPSNIYSILPQPKPWILMIRLLGSPI